MSYFVGPDAPQKTTVICGVDAIGARIWRGQYGTVPDEIAQTERHHAGEDTRIGIEAGV